MTTDLPIYYDHISVCTFKKTTDEEDLESIFRNIKDIDLPGGFLNRMVDINDDDIFESSIYFSESGSESPDDTENYIVVDYNSEVDELHIHPYLDQESLENGKAIFDSIIDVVGPMKVSRITVEVICPISFNEFSLPIKIDSDLQPNGVRFTSDDKEFLFQEMSDEATPEEADGGVYVRVHRNGPNTDVTTGESFIDEFIDEVEQDLSDLLEQ